MIKCFDFNGDFENVILLSMLNEEYVILDIQSHTTFNNVFFL